MNADTKAAITIGAFIASVAGLLVLVGRRRARRTIGDAESHDVLAVAADAFMEGDVSRGEAILTELPEERRTIARCLVARKKRYEKGNNWKGWKQISTYRLYKPLVADPLYGSAPRRHPYTEVTINATRTTNLDDGDVTDWVTVLGELGPTEDYPEGEYRFLVSGQQKASHSKALQRLGYDVVVPCSNAPLSG